MIARKLRFALRLSFMIGLPGMIVLGAGAHLLLSLFGPGYASDATVPLVLLAIGYPFAVPKALYIAVCRASGRITRAAVVLTTFSAVELGVAAAGALSGGLVGMSLSLLACRFVEALLVTPTVLRAAMGHGRHRRTSGVPTVVSGAPGTLAGRNGSRPPGARYARRIGTPRTTRLPPAWLHKHASQRTSPLNFGGPLLTGRQLDRNSAVESAAWACFTATI